MRTTFRLHYGTRPGQNVEVVIEGRPVPMTWAGSGWWRATVHVRRGAPYRYRVTEEGVDPLEEAGFDRHTPSTPANEITVVDRWRPHSPYRAARTSALFSRALAAHHPGPPAPTATTTGITF